MQRPQCYHIGPNVLSALLIVFGPVRSIPIGEKKKTEGEGRFAFSIFRYSITLGCSERVGVL